MEIHHSRPYTWYNTPVVGQSGGMADAGDLKSPVKCLACGFESRLWHHEMAKAWSNHEDERSGWNV